MSKRPLSVRRLFEQTRYAGRGLEKWLLRRGMPPPSGWLLPHFLGIGAQKAGTTWLHRQLRCHPDLFLPERKEIHYFDRQYQLSLSSYAAHFRGGRGRVRGEITPAYGVLPSDRIQFIGRIMPDLKLVLLLRNPVVRAWSHALMHVVKRPGRVLEEVPHEEFYAHFVSPGSRARGDYLTIVDHWLSVYPADRLFIGFFEDIRERPRELLSGVFRHLGVTDQVEWDRFPVARTIHGGLRARMPDPYREFLEGLYAAEIERMIERFGPRCEAWRPGCTARSAERVTP